MCQRESSMAAHQPVPAVRDRAAGAAEHSQCQPVRRQSEGRRCPLCPTPGAGRARQKTVDGRGRRAVATDSGIRGGAEQLPSDLLSAMAVDVRRYIYLLRPCRPSCCPHGRRRVQRHRRRRPRRPDHPLRSKCVSPSPSPSPAL